MHRFVLSALLLAVTVVPSSTGFTSTTRVSCHDGVTLWAKQRKAKQSKKVERSRPQAFYDAIEDAQGNTPATATKKKKQKQPETPADLAEAERQARAAEARRRMDERPDVSTMIVDEETGIEVVAQGKSVMDVVTRKAVKLSTLGPEYRLAQMFPGVPPDIREKHRFDWNTVEVPQMVDKLREACEVTLEDGSRGIPPHPSVANTAIDFILANRDYLGRRMKNTLGRLQLQSMSKGDKEAAQKAQKLYKNYLTLENHISAPFRQMIMDAEGRVGPNFGNLDLKTYCGKELYERCADYLVLKGMVAHWEKKVVDADYIEKNPQTKEKYVSVMARGDPRRYLPDPPILFTLRECTQVCLMAQQMTKAFVETPELYDDLPPELRFLEQALAIRGGTPLRKFVIEEFCPSEGITPEGLREGMRRLLAQLENMQVDPYADISNLVESLCIAMAIGTEDERDPYTQYTTNIDPNGPGGFQSYTFDHEQLSLVRFLDSQYERAGAKSDAPSNGLSGLFNFGGGQQAAPAVKAESSTSSAGRYKVPAVRAAGRPHELGWLELLDGEEDKDLKLGKVPPGRIIVE